jgi:hypothetical protein
MVRGGRTIEGRWRIVETDVWNREALDLVVPAYIRFDRGGLGEMQLIAIGASVDYRVEERGGIPIVEFSWSGFDEGDATSGRGWAMVNVDTMRGKLYIHQGDESTFVAERERGLRPAAALQGRRAREVGQCDICQFKVVLLELTPPIWRTIQVPESYSFWDLHVAIQDSMPWRDYHLHRFRVNKPDTGGVVQIGIPDDDAFEGDAPILPGWEVPIAAYFTLPGAVARYEYDFGDGWQHEVTLEASVPSQKGRRYPICLAGERACPPEDCGGVGGYETLRAVMRDPTHKEYESTLRWLGGSFDPDKFDPRKLKFDDPGKRWKLAFGKPAQSQRRGGHRPRRTR